MSNRVPGSAGTAAKRRPRILFVSTAYPTPWEPGKGAPNRSTVEALRLSGCDVRVVAPVPWPRRFAGGPTAHPAPAEIYPTYWYPPGLMRQWYHRALQWSIDPALDRISSTWQPDAVLSYWTDPDGTVAVRHARRRKIPGAVIVGGSDVMLLTAEPQRRHRIATTLAAASHVFAVGSVLRDRVIELGVPAARVSNFLSGADLTRFAPGDQHAARARLGLPPGGRLLLWIGNMVPVKAAERVLRAAAALVTAMPDLGVVLVGTGPLRAALEREVTAEPALAGRVTFAGSIDHDALPDWYQAADAFVLPSRSEGVPTVLVEAMACGLPFVASDVGSIRDLLPFDRSSIVAEGDVAGLTTALAATLAGAGSPVAPRGFDRLAGARHILEHLDLNRMIEP